MTDRATFEAHFGLTLRQQQRHKDGSYTDPITQARWEGWQVAPPPAGWRDFIVNASQTAGLMVNGNHLSMLAKRLLDAAPIAVQSCQYPHCGCTSRATYTLNYSKPAPAQAMDSTDD